MQNDFYPHQPDSVSDLPLFSGIPEELLFPTPENTKIEYTEASKSNSPVIDIKTQWVYDSYKAAGPAGATDLDISRFINLPVARIRELRKYLIGSGCIVPVMDGLLQKKRIDQLTCQANLLWKVKQADL